MEGKFLSLNDLNAYKISFNLSNYIWSKVVKWDYFNKSSLGEQFVTAADSISANIAEGFGRFGKKDKIKFYRYSIGSLKESLDWNEKSRVRKLLNEDEYRYIFGELIKLPKEIYHLINFTNNKLTI
jgi:four helix bundle protein